MEDTFSKAGNADKKISKGNRYVFSFVALFILPHEALTLALHGEGLSHILKDKKTTIIAIAHRLLNLENMDRILVMNEGRLVEQSRHHDLLQQYGSLYKKLWFLQKN